MHTEIAAIIAKRDSGYKRTRRVCCKTSPFDVYCGRAGYGYDEVEGGDGYFGNRFTASVYGSKEEAVRRFEGEFKVRINHDPEYKRRVESLRGRDLACHCRLGEICHVDVYVKYLEPGI